MQKEEVEALMHKKIQLLAFPDAVEVNENLTQDEKPVKRDKEPEKKFRKLSHQPELSTRKKRRTKK